MQNTLMFSKLNKHFFISACVVLVLSSCGNNKQEDIDDSTSEDQPAVALDSQKISAQNVFNAVPARTVIIKLVQEAQAQYNPVILNNPDDVNKYSTESSKALNLGVYGTDLNVTGVYEQTQESMLFLKCVNILAKSLGVSNAFDEKMVDRMEANKENRDSTLEIISQSFRNADNFLKANGRPGTSSLIVAGAWVEGMHVACNTAKETNNQNIVKEIFGQVESLKHLIELLESSKIGDDAAYVLSDLKTLKTSFEAKIDKVYTIDAIKDIDTKNSALRTKITSSK